MIEAETFCELEWMAFSATLLSFIRALIMFITLSLTACWLDLDKTKAKWAKQAHSLLDV